jgi:hypothetical protein
VGVVEVKVGVLLVEPDDLFEGVVRVEVAVVVGVVG